MSNLPPGTTQRDIDNLCSTDNPFPDRQECFGCKREIELDPASGMWFFNDECQKPYFTSDFLDSFPTSMGWFCCVECLDLYTDAGEVETPKLFLVKGGTE